MPERNLTRQRPWKDMASPLMMLLVFLGLLPLVFSHAFYRHVLTLIFLFAFLAEAWNLISGYGGLFSLAHAAFFGVGAYTTAILYVDFKISPWIGLPLGGILGVVVASIIGFATFRLRQFFFVLSTLACSEAIRALFGYWRLGVKTGLGTTIPRNAGFLNLTFHSELPYNYIAFALLVIVVLVARLVTTSKFGYYLRAIKDDEDAALSMGVRVPRVKLMIFATSAFFTAVGGGFHAMYIGYIEPNTVFNTDFMLQYILYAIVGGMATLGGPILGSVVLVPLTIFVQGFVGGKLASLGFFIYGIVLIVIIIMAPGGMMEGLRSLSKRWMRRRVPVPPAS
jgi:branched-chain amino acid transport system permease protein